MTEKEMMKALWLSRSLRNSAESQKFYLLSCALLAIGSTEKSKELKAKSQKYGIGAAKCIKKAIEFGFNPVVEKENKDEPIKTI